MATKRRMPPRHKSGPLKGKFRKRKKARRRAASKRRRTTRRKVATKSRRRPVARKRRRKAARRSSRRRNPPRRRSRARLTPRAIISRVTTGVQDAAGVLAGKAAARAIPELIGFRQTGAAGMGVQLLSGVVAAYVAEMFLGAKFGRQVMAGALLAPIESVIIGANIPILSPALAGGALVPATTSSYPSVHGVGAYPELPGGMGGYEMSDAFGTSIGEQHDYYYGQ